MPSVFQATQTDGILLLIVFVLTSKKNAALPDSKF